MASSPEFALDVSHLVKRYQDFTAVDDLSFQVRAGDFFAFLGPNGAGKTTTINAIVGLARVTSGSITIFGHDTVTDWRAARRLIGLAPQEYNFDRYLSVRDVLLFQAGYYGLRGRAVEARADELLARFDLTSKANDTFTKLSGGMKRRLSLARALIHEPQLLILDEPTAGVDVELRIELWDLLRALNAGGMTIVLTTHYLEEAEALCRNIAIIEGGKIAAFETTSGLLARGGPSSLVVEVDRVPAELPVELHALGRVSVEGNVVTVNDITAARVPAALAALASRYGFENVEFKRASLQDVFLDLVRK